MMPVPCWTSRMGCVAVAGTAAIASPRASALEAVSAPVSLRLRVRSPRAVLLM